jgi:L,D-peptidoglycan transpeptidase YkuD (ErfK/YbiS/YcfS/YnhG family)
VSKAIAHLHVFVINASSSKGVLRIGHAQFPCFLGKNGKTHQKREGDGKSPVGRWKLERLNYRPDEMIRPLSKISMRAMNKTDGWCDEAGNRSYNRSIKLPFSASHEELWRKDEAYDLVVTTNHNQRPRKQGGGSAIFLHVIRKGANETEGCIALSEKHLRIVLARCGRKTYLVI